mmetsp:Transcript_2236/g.5497  ORF Transcript_2236/g.5497 Transcript_2236/m.5497 type:complete len:576 (-) Transcript_2236:421-2148(-)|eukprot:CAMPEP_0181102012 /NCGR_PEP_ID=MMETSP1071-20121207/14075_1 /TAXON_ID=35127 /ORGANISM="Thalassiosira sp., Strain NH16" /LENGTH=575 /DNA_ID=CAMNT_0023184931 /DNA_START=158 /DNA_END=1885 /DNA_ORIENTATION=-
MQETLTSVPGAAIEYPAPVPVPVARAVTVVQHHPHAIVDESANNRSKMPMIEQTDKKNRRHIRVMLLVFGTLAIVAIPILALLRSRKRSAARNESSVGALPSLAPTSAGDEECQKKRVRITEICHMSGLDGEDEPAEIKVLVNDQHYWPKQTGLDCMDEYGVDGDSCIVPGSTLAGCFALRNSIELPFGGIDGTSTIAEKIKVTVYDTDFFWDDMIEIFAPKREWYRPNVCEKKEYEFSEHSYQGSAKIKMVVDFGELENPCGVEEDAVISGLDDAAVALENVQLGLIEYLRGVDEPRERRRLIFPLLATGFRFMAGAVATGGRSFVKLFTRQTRVGNALSTAADMTTIGSFLVSILGGDGNDGSSSTNSINNEALFDKVFERFDQIDGKLDNIEVQIKEGFNELKIGIEREFAEQELDDWVTFRLHVKLRGDYQGYMDRSHTALSRGRYEDIFRKTCNGDHSPYNIFQVLYSYSCLDCQRFSGKAQQYFLDTYVNLANANFENPTDRVLWFRRSFGTVIIGALTEAVYFYTVCLYRSKDECEVIDPVWDARLEEMGDALEEVVASLGEAETRLA